MSIIGHTFTPEEQDDFIDRVHEENPSVFVLCLRFGLAQPRALLTAVNNCFPSPTWRFQDLHHRGKQCHRVAEKGFLE
jgi:hypothetical protein